MCAGVGGKSTFALSPFQVTVCDEDDMICVVVMVTICYNSSVKPFLARLLTLLKKKKHESNFFKGKMTIPPYYVIYVFRSS